MTDFNLDELERIAARKELERETEKKEIERLEKLLKLPFYLRIQEKGQEEVLKKVEKTQKETFIQNSLKKWGINKEEAEDLFAEFMTEFLSGKTKSIRAFLLNRNYKELEND